MNINKQLTKGNKMRKMAIVIGILSVLATSAQAGAWVCKPNYKKEMKYKGYGDKKILYSTKMYGFRSWHKIDPNKPAEDKSKPISNPARFKNLKFGKVYGGKTRKAKYTV